MDASSDAARPDRHATDANLLQIPDIFLDPVSPEDGARRVVGVDDVSVPTFNYPIAKLMTELIIIGVYASESSSPGGLRGGVDRDGRDARSRHAGWDRRARRPGGGIDQPGETRTDAHRIHPLSLGTRPDPTENNHRN